jgi:formiminotetrahydrofolate cyclodeaminase
VNGHYIWQTAYLAAVYETNDEMMMGRILEARSAIEQRLLVPIEQDSMEHQEIVAARKALDVLKSERVDKVERPHTFASASSQPAHV